MHPQFTFALLAVGRGAAVGSTVALRGPYATRDALAQAREVQPHRFTAAEVLSWTGSASLPLLPSEASVAVFAQLRASPNLDHREDGAWRARPDTELHATADKHLMTFSARAGLWPVMKGESFDIWDNDRGAPTYYAWADPDPVRSHLQEKRLRSARGQRGSAASEFPAAHIRDETTLPPLTPRIAFRDVSRATDSRTIRVALIPPGAFLNHKSHRTFSGQTGDREGFRHSLLGALSSVAA